MLLKFFSFKQVPDEEADDDPAPSTPSSRLRRSPAVIGVGAVGGVGEPSGESMLPPVGGGPSL